MKRFLVIAAVLWGAWSGFNISSSKHHFTGGDETPSVEELTAFAATVKADDVLMYSTTECPNCGEAKAWLHRYGFPFTECNMSLSPQCEQEFRALGADGTPYLIVRGRHMKNGFDSDEFIDDLKG